MIVATKYAGGRLEGDAAAGHGWVLRIRREHQSTAMITFDALMTA